MAFLTKTAWRTADDKPALLTDALLARHAEAIAALPVLEDRLQAHMQDFWRAFATVYGDDYAVVKWVRQCVDAAVKAAQRRSPARQALDATRDADPTWFQGPEQVGMMLYVDLFAGDLKGIEAHLPYLKELGVTYLHLMPLLKPREGPNDGGYAVESFRAVDPQLGTMADLRHLAERLRAEGMLLVIDFVMNHTAQEHAWAQKALAGSERHQGYFFMFDDRRGPDAYERTIQDVFPDFAPGSFTYRPELDKWVWTTFYDFQWDLNYTNPEVFLRMLEEMLFLVGTGVDGLRLDAVPFLWKRLGTNCLNQPEAHELLRAYRALVRIAAPGVLFKSEAIVAPDDIIRYLGVGGFEGKECDIGYNAALMCHLWHALASENTQLLQTMLTSVPQAPVEAMWLNYIRCHDDIGWGLSDEDCAAVGQDGRSTRQYCAAFYAGDQPGSYAEGYRFQVDRWTGEARTTGTAAALTGLQKAQVSAIPAAIDQAVDRMLLLHRIIFAMRGMPLLYSGDEIGQLNDFRYLQDPLKAHDNRWTHRPPMDWAKAERRHVEGTVEHRLFHGIQRLAAVRKTQPALHGRADERLLVTENDRLFIVERQHSDDRLLLLANLSSQPQRLPTGVLPRAWHGEVFHDLLAGRVLRFATTEFVLRPYETLWLAPAPDDVPEAPRVTTPIRIPVDTVMGEDVFLVGNIPALGDGDIRQALGPLRVTDYPTWAIDIQVEAGTVFQFRWIKRRNGHVIGWSPHTYAQHAGDDRAYVL